MPGEPIIELAGVDVPRSQVSASAPVIQAVGWTVRRGDFWAVGGSAGSGKTDLLGTAAGLQRAPTGEQRLFGRALSQLNEEDLVSTRLRVAMVFASGRLFPHLTVAENLALPLMYHRQDEPPNLEDSIHRALEMTDLAALRDRRPIEITRNLHQRIGLARALALSPEVLLIDNPLNGIDPRQTRWWLDFLRDANSKTGETEPMTIVVAADDLRPWRDTARQFAVVRERRFELIGNQDQLQQSSEPAVRELLRGYER